MNYETIVRLLPDIIYKLDPAGNFIYINDSVRNLGYEPSELVSRHFSVLIHPDDIHNIQRDTVLKKIKKNESRAVDQPRLFDERRTGKRITKDLQVRLMPKNYQYREVAEKEVTASCRVIAVGAYYRGDAPVRMKFNGTVGVIKDIVNIRQSEGSLLRCIDYYQSLVENSHDIFMVLSPDGTILFAGPAVKNILGYRSTEIAGENIMDYLHAEDLKKVIRSYTATSPEWPVFTVNARVCGSDGDDRVFEITGKTVYDANGKPFYLTIVTTDVTRCMEAEDALSRARDEMERRVAERTEELARVNERLRMEIESREHQEMILLDSEKKYRSLVNSIDDLVFNMDPEGTVLFINPAVQKMTGYAQDEIIGSNIFDLFNREDIEALINSDRHPGGYDGAERNRFVEKVCVDTELRMTRKDGTEVWIELRCNPVNDPNGSALGLRGVAHDITRRRQTEEELLRASAIESLGVLAGGIAHDFNNYLTAILGNISLARVSLPRESESCQLLADAERASLMAKNLTQQLLSFSKEGKPVRVSTSLQNLLMDTAYFVLSGSPIKGEFHFPDSIWEASIDRGQIGQLFHNILLNARQSMPECGTISIRAENATIEGGDLQLAPGDYIRILISDQGCGIPEDVIPKIFDPYFSTKESGNGLGLAISYSIIKKHEGHIQVESKQGQGTMFTVYIPASRKKKGMHENSILKRESPGGKILLMDDEIILQGMGAKLLGHLGYEAVCVSRGGEAVRLFSQAMDEGRPFACVLLDLIIPNGQGAEKTIKELRELDPDVRAIVTSGYVNDPVMREYRKYGFMGALGKPFSLEDLERELTRVLTS